MFAILAEHDSDAEVLDCIVRKHFEGRRFSVKRKGYDGCPGLMRKGQRDIRAWIGQGISRFLICHDSDAHPPKSIRELVKSKIVGTSVATGYCIVVPVQEIEAWLIADETAINEVIPSFRFEGHPNPESIDSPKEWLIRKSRASNGKPLYSPTTFNAAVARRLTFDTVAKKCPSFREFLSCLDSMELPGIPAPQ